MGTAVSAWTSYDYNVIQGRPLYYSESRIVGLVHIVKLCRVVLTWSPTGQLVLALSLAAPLVALAATVLQVERRVFKQWLQG